MANPNNIGLLVGALVRMAFDEKAAVVSSLIRDHIAC
jgi:hypothetical protein